MQSNLSKILLFVGVGAVLVALYGGYLYFGRGQELASGQDVPEIHPIFTLTDMHGNVVTNRTYLGKKVFLFFGYTFCPDVCPTTLTTMTDALNTIENPDEWVGIFITVDPKRDTRENIKKYLVGNFHKNIVGLTGTDKQIAKAAKSFKAYYSVTEETKNDPNFYLMEHTAFVYFLDTKGQLSDIIFYDASTKAVLEKMRKVK